MRVAALLLLLQTAQPGPYVTIYHDDAVMLQLRRDRIKTISGDTYRIWLRWLWAKPQRFKSDVEVATVRVVDLDCKGLRVRELAVMHKNAEGKFYNVEEFNEQDAKWTVMKRDSGAGKAMEKACEFVPQLIESR